MEKDVSENRGTPKSSILISFSIINHPFWGTTIFGNSQKVEGVEVEGWDTLLEAPPIPGAPHPLLPDQHPGFQLAETNDFFLPNT